MMLPPGLKHALQCRDAGTRRRPARTTEPTMGGLSRLRREEVHSCAREHITALLRSHAVDHDAAFCSVALQVAAWEAHSGHHTIAE